MVTVQPALFVKPHCVLIVADATVLLIDGRCMAELFKLFKFRISHKGEMRTAVLSAAAFKPAFSYYPLNPLAILSSTFSIF